MTENMTGSLAVGDAGASGSSMGSINMAAAAGLESLEVDETTADEIINNVEKMINAEKAKDKAAKKDKKADQKTLDVTAGVIGAKGKEAAKAGGAASGTTPGLNRTGTTVSNATTESMSTAAEEKEEEEMFGAGALDQNMALIRRKTIAIKSDNISDVLMSNMGAITESVATFQKMEEKTNENDIGLQFQNQQENYENQV